MDGERTDAEILAHATREPALFGLLFDRHFETVYRYLERRVGRDAADELAGEVFRLAFEQRSRFRPLHESALPWLYGFATRLVLKQWRSEARHLRALARLDAATAAAGYEADDADERVTAASAAPRMLEALAALPPPDRDVLVLVAWEQLSYDEVAAALDVPPGTVRSRLNRARRRLRDLLPDLAADLVTANPSSTEDAR